MLCHKYGTDTNGLFLTISRLMFPPVLEVKLQLSFWIAIKLHLILGFKVKCNFKALRLCVS